MKRRIRTGLIVVFLLLLAVSLGYFALRLADYRRSSGRLQELAAEVNFPEQAFMAQIDPAQQGEQGAETSEAEFSGLGPCLVDEEAYQQRIQEYEKLEKQNSDWTAWIYIPDTRINYPVMQSIDAPDFYLTHNFDRQKSVYGVPYIAETCDLENGCSNIVVYGHHMRDGSMFAGLAAYQDEEYWKTHPYIYFETREDAGVYRIFGAMAIQADEKDLVDKMWAQDELRYSEFVAETNRRSFYSTGEIARYGEQLLTLVTCEYSHNNGRMVIVAKKISD